MQRQKIISEALGLPSRARADLAAKLLRSLDGKDQELTPAEWEATWTEEIKNRVADFRSGKTEALDGDEVLKNARRLLKSRRK